MNEQPIFDKEYVAVFASGLSVLSIPKEEIQLIKQKANTVFLNYAGCHFDENEIDYLIFSDKRVSEFYNLHWQDKPKYKLISRAQAFTRDEPKKIKNMIDYWFDCAKDRLSGAYTLVWLLQLLKKKYFINKPILLFGHDVDGNEKWYDRFISWDREKRGIAYNVGAKTKACSTDITKYLDKSNIWNCNVNSLELSLPKKDWKEIIV